MIRPMTLDDIPAILNLGEAMHAEGRFSTMTYDRAGIAEVLALTLAGKVFCCVSDNEGVDGFIIGVAEKAWHSTELCASEICLYVKPMRRGTTISFRLVKEFRDWAIATGAHLIESGVSTRYSPARTAEIYKKAGFVEVGPLLELER